MQNFEAKLTRALDAIAEDHKATRFDDTGSPPAGERKTPPPSPNKMTRPTFANRR
jgi:hypothetical protein